MRIHPREDRVRKAEHELKAYVYGLEKKHDLTEAELLRIVADVFGSYVGMLAKYMIRAERHPEDPGKPGGLE